MKKLHLSIFMLFFIGINLNAQLGGQGNTDFQTPQIIPQTPETASLLKYSETPISYHSGIPNISIPLLNLEGRDLSASVSISYHAGGLRVSEEATDIGLGWNLSAGGQITRTIRGFQDDSKPYGFINNLITVDDMQNHCQSGSLTPEGYDCHYLIGDNGQQNGMDFEPDDFNYSMMGLSGRFMFDQNRSVQNPKGNIIQFPNKNMIITPNYGGDGKIISWDIKDTNGVNYHFEIGNVFLNSQTFEYIDGAPELPTDGMGNGIDYTETWNLTKVTSLTGDEIVFEYETPTSDIIPWAIGNDFNCVMSDDKVILRSGTQSASNDQSFPKHVTTYTSTSRTEKYLKKIISSQGYIEFIKSNVEREDRQTKKHGLKFIKLYSSIGGINNKIKEVEFYQDYFIGETPSKDEFIQLPDATIPAGVDSFLNKRLKLNKVQFNNVEGDSNQSYSYEFNYNSKNLPHKRSFKQDAWGYYNGVNNSTLIPPFSYQTTTGSETIYPPNMPHANRDVNPDFTMANILTSIKYPEGGKKEFKYENNRGDSKIRNNPPYIQETFMLDALPSNSNNITQNGDFTTYKFFNNFSIPSDAKNSPLDEDKTIVEYGGFTSRCEGSDALYTSENAVCERMFFKIYEGNSTTPIITKPIWALGSVNLTKGLTYKLEIEITTQNDDYSFANHYSKVDLKWLRDNPNPTAEYFDYFGGLRIKDILDYNEDGLMKWKSFEYEKGHILSEPSFYTISMNNTHQLVSQSWVPLLTTQGSYVNYKVVKEIFNEVKPKINANNNDQDNTTSNLDAINDPNLVSEPDKMYIIRSYLQASNITDDPLVPFVGEWTSGRLDKENIGDKKITGFFNSFVGSETENNIRGYVVSRRWALNDTTSPYSLSNFHIVQNCSENSICTLNSSYNLWPAINLVYGKETTSFFNTNEELKSTESITYNAIPNHYNPTEIITSQSNGKSKRTVMKYPFELNNIRLLNENRINTQLENNIYEDDKFLFRVKTDFKDTHNPSNLYLPELKKGKKGALGSTEDRVIYHEYDDLGNILEVSKKDGAHVVYIWGYNKSQPIAKIENATYSEVSSLVSNLQTLSNNDVDSASEELLRQSLNQLRDSLPGSQVTTFTYDPLIGVTSITDPRGEIIYYEYDGFNRLQSVKDKDGNILSENQYNYKN